MRGNEGGLRLAAAAIAALLPGMAPAGDPVPVAVFDMGFENFSQEVDYGASNAAEAARIVMLSAHLRDLLAASGRYRVIDGGPAAADPRANGDVFSCNGCEAPLARELGASRSVTGRVQKMSVLVQTVILRERDAATGAVVSLYQTDIRGNTDEAWRRGLDWLVRNRLLRQEVP